jgi:putative methyltransferase (TIGR04325 family)
LDWQGGGAIVAVQRLPERIRVGMDWRLEAMYRRTKLLPGVRQVLEYFYGKRFASEPTAYPVYRGVYADYPSALADTPRTLPVGFDHKNATKESFLHIDRIVSADYPAMFWLERLFQQGCNSVFDLGGNMGVKYYAFRRYLDYPAELRWTVCELPNVVKEGIEWAAQHDTNRQLRFTVERRDASGNGILLVSGALQYLDYKLTDLIDELSEPPRHLLINVLPLHSSKSFFTVQKSAELYAPYRIDAQEDFIRAVVACGYEMIDHWDQPRRCDIPFYPEHSVEEYHGFLFSRSTQQ